MKRLRMYMIVFCVLISLPLAFVAWRSYGALDREARDQVRFFAERLLDEIESELADRVQREENRAVDEYRPVLMQESGKIQSPLARLPAEAFILGYFQNNPDGSFQSPLVVDEAGTPADLAERVGQLQAINTIFNQRKFVAQPPTTLPPAIQKPAAITKKEPSAFADRYLKTSERRKTKSVLGQEKTRLEEITAEQAINLAQREPAQKELTRKDSTSEEINPIESNRSAPSKTGGGAADKLKDEATPRTYGLPAAAPEREQRQMAPKLSSMSGSDRFQAEVTPLQAVAIDGQRMFIFRRIGINGQMYRQGFVLLLQPFLEHLLTVYHDQQPIARYAHLTLNAAGLSASRGRIDADPDAMPGAWVAGRTFPTPFGFLSAEMRAAALPPSPARRTLTLALAILGVVMVAGLVTIYHSARAVMDLSERRSRFVSAVTHELKTPLTNIRMYIEMLEQGIATTPEREQEYFGILASESARLSGLINNVLELSRLEKQDRRFDLKEGDLTDVLADVQSVMAERLAREGFELTIDTAKLPVCVYDRDVLVQVLINLMENSIKFGRHLPQKQIAITADAVDDWVRLRVSDSGPGIPKRSLKRVFDDFFRVDNELTRTTGGTGLGLALVKKFILAMGGRVEAQNNPGSGCTISLSLPTNRKGKIT